MAPPAIVSSLLLVCLLLPRLGSCTYNGGRHHVTQSSHSSRASTRQQACSSSIRTAGPGSGNRLPLVHRSSPCSPLSVVAEKQGHDDQALSSMDVFERDSQRLRIIHAAAGQSLAAAAAPAPPPSGGVTSPVAVTNSSHVYRGLEYSVMVGYGTPAQQLPMAFDTALFPPGVSTLRCRPCSSCNDQQPSFDPARSSTFSRVACGPECPSLQCSNNCSLQLTYIDPNSTVAANGTFVKDTLALSPSAASPSFAVACMDVDNIHVSTSSAGVLDLSPSRFSLVSRLVASSPATSNASAAFSYCLPAFTTRETGFLSIGGELPDLSGRSTPLVEATSRYVMELSGIKVGGTELPTTDPTTHQAVLELGTYFTYLKPTIYTALRDEFRKQMSMYTMAPPYRVLDTCYSFTGRQLDMPSISLEFYGGATLNPDVYQMMYFLDDGQDSVGCLAFAATPDISPYSVIGNMVQRAIEVVYDVGGGKVGFIPQSC